jgi:hypothetical protein
LDKIDLQLQIGKCSFHLIIEFIGLDDDRLGGLVDTEVLSDIETHADLSFFDGFVEGAFEYFGVDEYVDDFVGVFGGLG